jgi:hypothetical protein
MDPIGRRLAENDSVAARFGQEVAQRVLQRSQSFGIGKHARGWRERLRGDP